MFHQRILKQQYDFDGTIFSVELRGGISSIFSSLRQARAKNVKPGRAQACQIIPRAYFEPELFTNKSYKILTRAYIEFFLKFRVVKP